MPETNEETPAIIGMRGLIVLGAALLAGFAVCTGFAIYQKSQRTSIEHIEVLKTPATPQPPTAE